MDMFMRAGFSGREPCTQSCLTLMGIYGEVGATPYAGKLLADFLYEVYH